MPEADHAAVARALAGALGGSWHARSLNASGFCATWRAESGSQVLFVKTQPLAQAETLAAEADGLQALTATNAIKVPAVHACCPDSEWGLALLAMQWLDLRASDAYFGARLGRAVAHLHRAPLAEGMGRFGWRRDNFVGATPQSNRWSEGGSTANWIGFLRRERFGVMRARLAASAPRLCDAVEALEAALPQFFDDGYVPRASLIHGDLWSGNWGMDTGGTPVIFDPAVSCSDAEAELAMMELFGQPPPGFWAAYRQQASLHAGYARRRGLYQLYHLLNHAVLFGGGYVGQAERVARELVQ